MNKIIAYCGLNCAECDAYKATMNNDNALREKTAAEWTKAFNFKFTLDMINCTSCTGQGVKIGHCSQCEMRNCAVKKGVVNCGACADFKTCKTINDFLKQVPDAAKNFAEAQA